MAETVYVPHDCDTPGPAGRYLPGTEWQCPACRALWEVTRFAGTMEGAVNVWCRLTDGRKVPRPVVIPTAPDPADVLLARLMRARRAWTDPGPHPRFHARAQQRVRELMPVLAEALDYAAAYGRRDTTGDEAGAS